MRLIADVASAAIIAVVAVLVALTFRDYGITWDETWHMVYGDMIVDWFLSGGVDESALSYRMDYLYCGGFDALGAVARRLAPAGLSGYEVIHLFGAMVGVLGMIGTWRLARLLGGPVAGLIATLMLATTPSYYGHMFNNPKDLPFAVGHIWAVYALCIVATKLPTVPRRDWVRLAVLCGLAMSVRIGGLLVLCYLVALVGGYALSRWAQTRRLEPAAQVLVGLGRPTLQVILGAWIVMLSTWPWALLDPLRRPFMALGRMSRYTIHVRRMPFAGEDMLTTEPRWDYLLHYFGLKLPVLLLGLLLIAVVLVVVAWRKHGTALLLTGRGRALAVLAFAIVFPPAYAMAVSSVLYDGLRHFLFLVPLMVVAAAVTAVALPRWIGGRQAITQVILVLGIGGLCVRVADHMRTLHPHQYVYFNPIGGGLPGAFLRYDTDYYGNSYKEAFEQLAEHLWHNEPEVFLDTAYILHGCIPDEIAYQYLEPNFRWKERESWRLSRTMKKGRPDFYIGYTRANCHNRFKNDPVLLQVERDATLLNVVRDRRTEKAEAAAAKAKSKARSKKAATKNKAPKKPKNSQRKGATWDKPGADKTKARPIFDAPRVPTPEQDP